MYVLATTDAKELFLEEYGYQIRKNKANEPLGVKLTIDYHMQKLAEEVMDNMVDKGAVAIVDILNGDV